MTTQPDNPEWQSFRANWSTLDCGLARACAGFVGLATQPVNAAQRDEGR